MVRLSNAKASVIQGLIAPKGLDCLKAKGFFRNLRISLKEEEEKEEEMEKNTSP